jgi:hypothetical protein
MVPVGVTGRTEVSVTVTVQSVDWFKAISSAVAWVSPLLQETVTWVVCCSST